MATPAGTPQPMISFATGSLGSVPLLESVIGDALRHVDPGLLLRYGDPMGMPELRHRIARFHPGVDADQVMVTASAQQGLALVFEHLLGEGCTVLVQQPAYFGALRLLKAHGLAAGTFYEGREVLEGIGTASALYLTSNFQNPTGVSLSAGEKQRIAALAPQFGAVIVEDNPYDLLYYEEKPTTIRQNAPQSTIYVSGFSKILGPGIRVGYVVADREKLAQLKSRKIDQDLFTSTLGQQLCLAALQTDYLDALRAHFKAKRDLALASLEQYLGGAATWARPAGGIFLLLSLPAAVPVSKVREIAAARHCLVLEDDRYAYLDGRSRNTLRVNFVQNPDDLLVEGVRRLARTLEEAREPWNSL
jgi:2-aminoadipate transaminase